MSAFERYPQIQTLVAPFGFFNASHPEHSEGTLGIAGDLQRCLITARESDGILRCAQNDHSFEIETPPFKLAR